LGSAESGEILSAGRAADALIRSANISWAMVLNQNVVADEVRALLAENEKLRETAHQLLVEIDALQKRRPAASRTAFWTAPNSAAKRYSRSRSHRTASNFFAISSLLATVTPSPAVGPLSFAVW
jgi:hypothetical protein